jgi:pSer/pThr/pTyr-binding forkhead associated (FHA) protein
MLGQLVPCGGGDPIPLLKSPLVVGRTPDCDLTIPLGTVSSKHCILEFRDAVWHVRDLDSRNGVRIDGVRCREGRLNPRSVLWIAQNRYQVDYISSRAVPRAAGSPKSALRAPGSDSTQVELPRQAGLAPWPLPRSTSALGELIPCGGGPCIALAKPTLIVGRSPACDITLESPLVSSKHCQLEFKEGFWHIRDLGSRNGIRVDGIVHLAKYLKPGEILSIAKLRYEIAYTPGADEPPPEENPFALGLLEKAGLVTRGAAGAEPRLPRVHEEEPQRKKWSIDENDMR